MHDVPFDDPSIAALTADTRAALATHWSRRARSELQVGRAFAAMAPLFHAHGADAEVVERLARGAEQEERHARLCVSLAEAYGGVAVALPEIGDVPLPSFGGVDDELERALLVAGMCCINETIATAWLSAGLAVATAPIAIAANRTHLRDEIEHARLGWAHLASRRVSARTRAALATRLPKLLAANAPGWEADDAALPAAGLPSHGHLAATDSRAVVHEALRDLVLPGFAHVGVDTRAAEAWLEARSG